MKRNASVPRKYYYMFRLDQSVFIGVSGEVFCHTRLVARCARRHLAIVGSIGMLYNISTTPSRMREVFEVF